LGRILITGGAGYIGSAITELLAGRDPAAVIVLDNLSQGHRASIPDNVAFIQADLSDASALQTLFARHAIDAVIHLAAVSVVGDSVTQPLKYYRENVANLLHLLEAMQRAGCRRMVFSSTASVYGQPAVVPTTEECPPAPINPYGWSKRMGEQILDDALHAGATGQDFRFVALRYFNVAGATPRCGEMHHPETHLVPRVLEVALGQRPHLELYGTDYETPDGTCIRDYIHTLDLAEAHLLALNYTQGDSGIFNLGSNHGYSVREVVECARRITGHPIPLKEFPRRPGDPPRLVASHSRARAELAWQPTRGLDQMISSAWDWRCRHPRGYSPAPEEVSPPLNVT
jgi:UDP-glucose 4-epimerase